MVSIVLLPTNPILTACLPTLRQSIGAGLAEETRCRGANLERIWDLAQTYKSQLMTIRHQE
jgi:hypothetical protein